MKTWKFVVAGAVCLLLGVSGVLVARNNDAYELRLVVPSAAQVVTGAQVRVNGAQVGRVAQTDERDGKAVITVAITDEAYTPLHAGTTSRIEWQSALGERVVAVTPGPSTNAALPSGAMYEAESVQVEADQVLAALDAPTRERLTSLLHGLHRTTDDKEHQIRDTVQTAGPTVRALEEILSAVGRDGPAIRTVVSELHELVGGVASRQDKLSTTVHNLTDLTGSVGQQSRQLADGLGELPPTLDAAKGALDKVPAVTEATTPLLTDLRPATARLPSVAGNLEPVMQDLRPVVGELRPTLHAAHGLLDRTPALLDTAHQTLPPVAGAMQRLSPALEFLRPYSPEVTSFVNLFGGSFAAYDSQGHGWSVLATPGPASAGELPGEVPLAGTLQRPAPGTSVGQPWTDADGGEIR